MVVHWVGDGYDVTSISGYDDWVGGDTYCGVFAGACDGCAGKGRYCDVFVGG